MGFFVSLKVVMAAAPGWEHEHKLWLRSENLRDGFTKEYPKVVSWCSHAYQQVETVSIAVVDKPAVVFCTLQTLKKGDGSSSQMKQDLVIGTSSRQRTVSRSCHMT